MVKHAVVQTNPLKNIRRTMHQLNIYAAVVKKNAELTATKNLRTKAAKVAKATGKPALANPMAKRAAKTKTKVSKKSYVLRRESLKISKGTIDDDNVFCS